jgi:hypothetical protein
MATLYIQAVTVNELATGRGLDLKLEILMRISCVHTGKKGRTVTDALLFCYLTGLIDST